MGTVMLLIAVGVVSDVVWQAIIAGVVAVVLAWLQMRTRQAVEKAASTAELSANAAAKKTDDVKASVERASNIAATSAKVAASKVAEAAIKVEEASVRVEEVKQALEENTKSTNDKLDGLSNVATDTHTLVNSNMGIQLRLNMELSMWKADREPTKENIEASDNAKKTYEEHMVKQGKVDSATNSR